MPLPLNHSISLMHSRVAELVGSVLSTQTWAPVSAPLSWSLQTKKKGIKNVFKTF